MLKLLVIDDASCKKDLEMFLNKHKQAVVHAIATENAWRKNRS